jgi:hypothetical protein
LSLCGWNNAASASHGSGKKPPRPGITLFSSIPAVRFMRAASVLISGPYNRFYSFPRASPVYLADVFFRRFQVFQEFCARRGSACAGWVKFSRKNLPHFFDLPKKMNYAYK